METAQNTGHDGQAQQQRCPYAQYLQVCSSRFPASCARAPSILEVRAPFVASLPSTLTMENGMKCANE